jgi:hypothetical protein
MSIVQAERVRVRDLLIARGSVSNHERRKPPPAESLMQRQKMMESRLEELEARAAYLRAELEHAKQASGAE